MRKVQQAKILELLEVLREAHDILRKQIMGDFAVSLLADCQELALKTGEYIETIEDEGKKTITILEEYCELAYQASLESNLKGYSKRLQSQLSRIENSVQSELKPNKIEVVFFPYLLSMFDAFESIYHAAKADQSCDVYVVPIPWFEKLSNGTLGNCHYDGDQYPEYIPITNWQEYDVETRQPDVIFIHNPYDNDNYVTSVHPNYYSSRLRKYTECLVYIPYFVCPNDAYGDLCTTMGCIYSHKTILQSEKVCNTYIRIFKESFGNRFGKPKEKFIALGSPKFDAVLKSKQEDFTLPPAWQQFIFRADGTRKKIVLYNTTIGAALQGNMQYLSKLKSLLSIFKKEDVVLWWRPHPLNDAMYRSMRSGILEEYKAIIMAYKQENWGIYDDTPDLHRAISLSDLYYGDYGSIPALYQATDKPIIHQNINLINNDIREEYRQTYWNKLRFGDFIEDDQGNIWAYGFFHDGLFKLNFDTDVADFVLSSGVTPQYMGIKGYTHRFIALRINGSKLIGFPALQNNILVYDFAKCTQRLIPIDSDCLMSTDADGFCMRIVAEWQGKYYCFSSCSSSLIVFDLSKESIEYHHVLTKEAGLYTIGEKSYSKQPLYISDVDEQGCVRMLLHRDNKLIKYNLEHQQSKIILENNEISSCLMADMDTEGKFLWLFEPEESNLYEWDLSCNKTRKFNLGLANFLTKHIDSFISLVDCGEYLLLFPKLSNMLVLFDKISEEFSEYTDMPVPGENDITTYKYDRHKKVGDKLFAFARYNAMIYELDIVTRKVKGHELKPKFDNLSDWIKFISEKPSSKNKIESNAGKNIYDYVKGLCQI